MTGLRRRSRSRWAHAVRVAAAVASIIAVLYVAATVSFDVVDTKQLVAQVDSRVKERLVQLTSQGGLKSLATSSNGTASNGTCIEWDGIEWQRPPLAG